MSDEGFKVELRSDDIPSPFEINLPTLRLSVPAKLVWARQGARGDTLICGAQVSRTGFTEKTWQLVLDAV